LTEGKEVIIIEKMIEEELMKLNTAKLEKISNLDEAADIAKRELKELRVKEIISESKYQDLSLKYGHVFEARIGAEAIGYLLKLIKDLCIQYR